MNLKMTNLGIFNKYLEDEIQKKIDEKSSTSDVYEQMLIDAEKRLLEKTLMQYKNLICNQ